MPSHDFETPTDVSVKIVPVGRICDSIGRSLGPCYGSMVYSCCWSHSILFIPGILDQGSGILVVFDDAPVDKTYENTQEMIAEMGKVVDALYKKAKKLQWWQNWRVLLESTAYLLAVVTSSGSFFKNKRTKNLIWTSLGKTKPPQFSHPHSHTATLAFCLGIGGEWWTVIFSVLHFPCTFRSQILFRLVHTYQVVDVEALKTSGIRLTLKLISTALTVETVNTEVQMKIRYRWDTQGKHRSQRKDSAEIHSKRPHCQHSSAGPTQIGLSWLFRHVVSGHQEHRPNWDTKGNQRSPHHSPEEK